MDNAQRAKNYADEAGLRFGLPGYTRQWLAECFDRAMSEAEARGRQEAEEERRRQVVLDMQPLAPPVILRD